MKMSFLITLDEKQLIFGIKKNKEKKREYCNLRSENMYLKWLI
jgi:hypothetical protein